MDAFVLVGGATKGILGHISFLKAMEEAGIKPDIILGASAGSVIGSFYASGKPIDQIYEDALKFSPKDYVDFVPWYKLVYQIINSGKGLKGVLLGERLEGYIEHQLGDRNEFSLVQTPLYVAAINLNKKRIELINTGKVSEAVRASAGIPTIYYPKKIGDSYYIDGAVGADNLPYMLVEAEPKITRLFICNFTSELRKQNSDFIEERDWPLLEIINRTIDSVLFSMSDTHAYGIPIYTITPAISVSVDFVNPSVESRKIAYQQGLESCRQQIKDLKLG